MSLTRRDDCATSPFFWSLRQVACFSFLLSLSLCLQSLFIGDLTFYSQTYEVTPSESDAYDTSDTSDTIARAENTYTKQTTAKALAKEDKYVNYLVKILAITL